MIIFIQLLSENIGFYDKKFCKNDDTQPVKIDLYKKLVSKQKTIQTFNIDA